MEKKNHHNGAKIDTSLHQYWKGSSYRIQQRIRYFIKKSNNGIAGVRLDEGENAPNQDDKFIDSNRISN